MALPDKSKRCILVILDGVGDRSYKELNYQTPLQAAETPILDSLAQRGANGLYHPSRMGLAMPSENAHFTIFGYDADQFPGRGALEALGAGVPIRPEDVAILTHFVTVEEKNGCLRLGSGFPIATEEDTAELIRAIECFETENVKIRFHRTEGLFGVLVFSGHVSPYITDTDPITAGHLLSDVRPWQTHTRDHAAQNTANALKVYLNQVYRKLQNHPVNLRRIQNDLPQLNMLVTQRAGQLKMIPFFRERYGLCGISISSGILYKGICAYIGMDFRPMTDSKDYGKDLAERLELAYTLSDTYDFIHVHTKVPDMMAHTKDPIAKKNAIEALDRGMGKAIRPILEDPEVMLVVTADHSTPSSGPLVHSGEPVPIVFCGKGARRDKVVRFDEISAAGGALSLIRGKELIYLILNHLNRIKLCGLMDTPSDQIYWPGDYEPLRIV